MTNPDARVVGVQTATTLSCHSDKRNDGSASTGSTDVVEVDAAASTSALSDVNSRTASRPAATCTICVHWYAFPWNATGRSDSTLYFPGRSLTSAVPSAAV